VYAGGDFRSIGGRSRDQIAALDATTGRVMSWNPAANGTVQTIAVSGSTVYAGGGFTAIAGRSRRYVAALSARTGQTTAWNPGCRSGSQGGLRRADARRGGLESTSAPTSRRWEGAPATASPSCGRVLGV
jgi:hypothetical protein